MGGCTPPLRSFPSMCQTILHICYKWHILSTGSGWAWQLLKMTFYLFLSVCSYALHLCLAPSCNTACPDWKMCSCPDTGTEDKDDNHWESARHSSVFAGRYLCKFSYPNARTGVLHQSGQIAYTYTAPHVYHQYMLCGHVNRQIFSPSELSEATNLTICCCKSQIVLV